MRPINDFIGEDAPWVRQTLREIGFEYGVQYKAAGRSSEHLVVAMGPLEADFMGEGFRESLGDPAWSVLWNAVFEIPHAGYGSIQTSSFKSCKAKGTGHCTDPKEAVILFSMATTLEDSADIRGMVLSLVSDIPLDKITIICPWMSQTVWDDLSQSFPDDFSAHQPFVGFFPDSDFDEISMPKLANLPSRRISYMPSCVMKFLNDKV